MFKNIILGRRAGKNFKISDPMELRFKLRLFNQFSGLNKKIDYMDILNVSCFDYIRYKMTKKQFLTIAFMIMDAVEKENYKLTHKVNRKIWVSLKIRRQWRLARFFKKYFVQKKEINKVRGGVIS